ncbi:hypothetical protein [Pseudohongiella spirulinae]|uniref:Uncharacterized protein n=1 Tax=Pseudohongiella spirulinae TaxID=1249552 RepID=A0A0S2KH06_9GAMM|nr:hypothetical protein [Pseudohongiella spirulinae]ALO47461.1 hypothetical protein PS2015_2830 [Pseudohongiella spirulinae]
MKNGTLFGASLLLAIAGLARAEAQPVYDAETETLVIPSAIAQGQPGRFQDVLLEPAGDGLWRVARLHEGVLLDAQYVDEVWTSSTTGLPRQMFIHLAGTFNSGCPEVGRIEQQRHGNTLDVYVYYRDNAWLRDPESVACTMAMEPFELDIALNIHGLQAGEYELRVNGQQLRSFVLAEKNVAPRQFGGQRRSHCQYEPRRGAGWSAYSCSDATDIELE